MTPPSLRLRVLPTLLLSGVALVGCAHRNVPEIAYDDPAPIQAALPTPETPKPATVVEVPTPLPLPGQLKPLPGVGRTTPPELLDPRKRIEEANAAARVQPTRAGYINAVQVYPFADGALYQLYAAPGEVTDVALQEGEQLVGAGPVAAGDTVRWIIGDTESGTGTSKRVHILVKPTRADLWTNLVVNTDRRTYHLEMRSTERTYMASVSWQYAADRLIALRAASAATQAAAPIETGVDVARLRFRYRIEGDRPAWRPLSAFDDGVKVYIEMPGGLAQGEAPPLFVLGADGKASSSTTASARPTTSSIGCSPPPSCVWAASTSRSCGSSAPTRGADHDRRSGDLARAAALPLAPDRSTTTRARYRARAAAPPRAAARHAHLAQGARGCCCGRRGRGDRRGNLRASTAA